MSEYWLHWLLQAIGAEVVGRLHLPIMINLGGAVTAGTPHMHMGELPDIERRDGLTP